MSNSTIAALAFASAFSILVSPSAFAHCGKSPSAVSLTVAGSGDAKNGSLKAANRARATFKAALDEMAKAKTKAEMAAARDKALAAIEAQRGAFAAWASGTPSGNKAVEANTAKAKKAASDVTAYAASHIATLKS
jgi:hypothetical protein